MGPGKPGVQGWLGACVPAALSYAVRGAMSCLLRCPKEAGKIMRLTLARWEAERECAATRSAACSTPKSIVRVGMLFGCEARALKIEIWQERIGEY